MHRNPKRQAGNAVTVVILIVFLLGAVLGLNYVRNYQTVQQDEKQSRPYARYQLGDLEVLAEGYRMEIQSREKRHGAGRVQTRTRHHF